MFLHENTGVRPPGAWGPTRPGMRPGVLWVFRYGVLGRVSFEIDPALRCESMGLAPSTSPFCASTSSPLLIPARDL